jgi:Flp pilus assembly pilin Flp
MTKFLNRVRRDEKGVTALEYGLIAALVAVVIIGAVTVLAVMALAPAGRSLLAPLQTIAQHLVH